MRRIACVWVPWFAAAAAERCEPALVDRPLAIVRGTPPVTRVVEANAAAREQGVAPDMTETEARARCPTLACRRWSAERTAAARLGLLDAVFAVSPRIEDAAAGLVYVDTDGLDRLIGDARAIGERLLRQARAVGLHARVGLAHSRAAAWVVARAHPRMTIAAAGEESAALAPVPLDVLELPAEVAATLRQWGVRSLGELAALPRDGVALRLGPAGLRAHDLALGIDRNPFRPWTPPPFWVEGQELEWEVRELAALAVTLRAVLERLTARLGAAHLATDQLTIELRLASAARHTRTIGLAYPVLDVDTMLRLVRLDLEAHPPDAAVTGVTATARPVRTEIGQGGLWRPALPAHHDLAALLARLVELVGRDNCGAPALTDSHRPDAGALTTFLPSEPAPAPAPGADAVEPRLVVRRLHPPHAVEVVTADERPLRLRRGAWLTRVVTAAGPWRTSGEWWDARAWARDEWDVLLDDGTLARLVHDPFTKRWYLDGIYD